MGIGSSKEPEPQVNLDQYLQSAEYQQKMQAVYSNQQQSQQALNVPSYDDDDLFYAGHNSVKIHQQKTIAGVQQTTLTAQKNDIYINKTSFKLVKCGATAFSLTFQYSCPTEGEIGIWYLGQENMNTSQITSQYKKEQINTFLIQPSQNAEFAPNQSILDLNCAKIDQLKHFEIKQDQFSFPLIVKISKLNVDHSFTYYCNIVSNQPNLNPHCQASKLRVNGQNFLTQDVYGMNDSVMGKKNDEDKEPCRICLTNIIDTMIKPCQHVVLCQECCLNLRMTGQKCPICRTEIKEFVIIKQGK